MRVGDYLVFWARHSASSKQRVLSQIRDLISEPNSKPEKVDQPADRNDGPI
jgi:hypothetical protein